MSSRQVQASTPARGMRLVAVPAVHFFEAVRRVVRNSNGDGEGEDHFWPMLHPPPPQLRAGHSGKSLSGRKARRRRDSG